MKNDLDIYEPFKLIRRNFDDFFEPFGIMKSSDFRTPLVNIQDKGKEFEINVELPGVKKEDIEVDAHKQYITIKANTKNENEEKDKTYYKYEMSSNSFSRTIPIPQTILPDEVDGEFKNGVLSLIAPKENPKPKEDVKRVKIK